MVTLRDEITHYPGFLHKNDVDIIFCLGCQSRDVLRASLVHFNPRDRDAAGIETAAVATAP